MLGREGCRCVVGCEHKIWEKQVIAVLDNVLSVILTHSMHTQTHTHTCAHTHVYVHRSTRAGWLILWRRSQEHLQQIDLAESLHQQCSYSHCHCIEIQSGGRSSPSCILMSIIIIVLLLQSLEEKCLQFSLNHMSEVVQSEAFDQLDNSIAKSFVQKAAQRGAFKTWPVGGHSIFFISWFSRSYLKGVARL